MQETVLDENIIGLRKDYFNQLKEKIQQAKDRTFSMNTGGEKLKFFIILESREPDFGDKHLGDQLYKSILYMYPKKEDIQDPFINIFSNILGAIDWSTMYGLSANIIQFKQAKVGLAMTKQLIFVMGADKSVPDNILRKHISYLRDLFVNTYRSLDSLNRQFMAGQSRSKKMYPYYEIPMPFLKIGEDKLLHSDIKKTFMEPIGQQLETIAEKLFESASRSFYPVPHYQPSRYGKGIFIKGHQLLLKITKLLKKMTSSTNVLGTCLLVQREMLCYEFDRPKDILLQIMFLLQSYIYKKSPLLEGEERLNDDFVPPTHWEHILRPKNKDETIHVKLPTYEVISAMISQFSQSGGAVHEFEQEELFHEHKRHRKEKKKRMTPQKQETRETSTPIDPFFYDPSIENPPLTDVDFATDMDAFLETVSSLQQTVVLPLKKQYRMYAVHMKQITLVFVLRAEATLEFNEFFVQHVIPGMKMLNSLFAHISSNVHSHHTCNDEITFNADDRAPPMFFVDNRINRVLSNFDPLTNHAAIVEMAHLRDHLDDNTLVYAKRPNSSVYAYKSLSTEKEVYCYNGTQNYVSFNELEPFALDKAQQMQQKKKHAIIFDFDHTLVNINTDTYLFSKEEQKLLIEDARHHRKTNRLAWREAVQRALNRKFESLKEMSLNQYIHQEAFKDVEFPMYPFLKKHLFSSCDVFIVSDANTKFIEAILNHVDPSLKYAFKEIITNPAYWVSKDMKNQDLYQSRPPLLYECPKTFQKGQLYVEPFMRVSESRSLPWLSSSTFTPSSHTCTCQENMCKHAIVSSLRDAYERVCYIGDGKNDFCAMMALRHNDLMCVREGFSLSTFLESSPTNTPSPFCFWKTHPDLEKQLQKFLNAL